MDKVGNFPYNNLPIIVSGYLLKQICVVFGRTLHVKRLDQIGIWRTSDEAQ